MKKTQIEIWSERAITIVSIFVPLIFIFYLFRAKTNRRIYEDKQCAVERQLVFDGIVSNYKTDVSKEKSEFLLNDSILTVIPRSSKEMMLRDGDTIQKSKNANTYIIRRGWLSDRGIDTITFECDEN